MQINGRKRAEITVERTADAEACTAVTMASDAVLKILEGRTPRKVIVVPMRIVNVVV